MNQVNSDSGSQYQLVTENSKEWNMIIDLFKQRDLTNYKIIRIEQNKNDGLKRKCEEREKKAQSVKYLFHGSRANKNYDNIMNGGFDLKYASPSGSLGKGLYFANRLTYSTNYTYNIKTEIGLIKNVLLARVSFVSGSYKEGSDIYAVFDNYDAYPEFVIYYKDPNIE